MIYTWCISPKEMHLPTVHNQKRQPWKRQHHSITFYFACDRQTHGLLSLRPWHGKLLSPRATGFWRSCALWRSCLPAKPHIHFHEAKVLQKARGNRKLETLKQQPRIIIKKKRLLLIHFLCICAHKFIMRGSGLGDVWDWRHPFAEFWRVFKQASRFKLQQIWYLSLFWFQLHILIF